MAVRPNEELLKSLNKVITEEGAKKKPSPEGVPRGGRGGSRRGRNIPQLPNKNSPCRTNSPGGPGKPVVPVRTNRPSVQDVPVRNKPRSATARQVASVPRPSTTQRSVSGPIKPPAPPPRNRGSTPELNELPQIQNTPTSASGPNLQMKPQQRSPRDHSGTEIPTEERVRPVPRYPVPLVPNKSSMLNMKKEGQQQDPEDFYRSVRKLTQYPIATDRGSIRVLQLEGMDGVAWSEFEERFETAGEEEPPELANLFNLHQYDYEVCTRERVVDSKHQQFLESLLQDEQLNSFSRECVLCFLNNWKIVKGSLFDHSLDKGSGGGSRRIVTVNVDKSKPHSVVSPRTDLENTKKDTSMCSIEPHIFDQSTEEAVCGVKEAMEEHLPKHLFKSLHGEIDQEMPDNSYSYLEQSEPFNFASTQRLSIECSDLRFTAGIEEPYYCSLALYDVKARTKLCETFHFELNQDELFKLFKKGTSIFCSVTRCLIPLATRNRSSDICLVLRIDKLLSNDIEKDFSRYQKKPGKKGTSSNPPWDHWKDMGFIRQPFVWAAIPLYEEGKMVSGKVQIDEFIPIRSMWTEDFIYDSLTAENANKKGKVIPGSITLDINMIDEFPSVMVDSSLNFVTSQGAQNTHGKLVKEVEWFGSQNIPFLNYVNNLFVYPQSVVIKHHHPNIRVKVELLGDDNYPNSRPLIAIYTPWGGKPFCREGYTSLCAKEKRPIFADEIKIQLPGVLTEKHHILFTIINNPNNEVLGFAYTPIFSSTHGVIKNALRTLVIEPQLEAGYLSKEVEPVKITETKKPYLCFKTCLISSIYPESNALFSLSHVLTKNGMVNYEGNPEQVLQVIHRLPPPLCISFFPAILNCLFKLIASGDQTLAPLAVIDVISVLTKVTQISGEKSTKCNSMLLSYVRYLFDPIMTASSTVHDSLVKYWCDFIDKDRPEVKNLGQGEIWILLNVVLKSSIMKLCELGPPRKNARLTMFAPSYAGSLEKLVLSLFCVKTEIRNMDVLTMVPLFMKDLLGIIDRGVVFEMIFGYICWLNSENQTGDLFLATVKFTFIKIITNYKYYVPLNLPTEISITSKDIGEIVQQFWTKHFFAGLIVREVRAGLLQKQRIREQSIALLLDLLHSHDVDPRYSDLQKKTRIVGLYFPYVITAVEFHQVLEDYLAPEEKINWLLCFFYIVENCSRSLLHQWWDSCDAERNAAFFKLLEMASVAFKGHSLYTPCCFIMVDMILDYITTYEKNLQQPNNIELPQIFAVLQQLQHNQTVGFVIALYNLLAAISKLYSKPIFCQPKSSYCGSLTYQVLFHCNSEKVSVRNKACSLFYFLLRKNFEETKDVERMKLQSTISLCKLLSCEQKVKGYSNLRNSLAVVRDYAQKEEDTLKELIESAVHQVSRLLRFNEQLAENDQNPQVMAELFLKIAHSYFHTPNLLMTWLEALAAHHKKSECWVEAALVHAQLACIQVEYFLRIQVHQFPVDFFSFRLVFPECNLNSIPEDTIFSEDEFANCTLENIITHIHTAIDLLKQANQFELVLVLYSMLSEIYMAHSMLADLVECLAQYSQATTGLMKANKDTRLFSTYFRVVFFGKMFGEEDGRQFIYRMAAKENLMTVQQYLKNIVSKTYGADEEKIEVLGNQAIDKASLDPDTFYLQVASVSPYHEESEEKRSLFQVHFDVDKFLFESSIGKGDQQSKKKTIFHVVHSFPYINSRLEITKTEEIILTPLESAIDLIEDRVGKFKAELNVDSHHDVRINQLQQLLQGSVVPMVHEGPLKICETYLSKESRDNHPPEQIAQLEEAMSEFIKLCGFGVKLVNQVIELRHLTEYEQFQDMIEKHYKIMREKLRGFLSNELQ